MLRDHCQAIGWQLEDELVEIERVVRPGGTAWHLFGAPGATEVENPLLQSLVDHGYEPDTYRDGGLSIHRYRKQIPVEPEVNRDPVG